MRSDKNTEQSSKNCSDATNLSAKLTVYLTPKSRQQMQEIADYFNVSVGLVARLTLEDKLEKYFSNVQYIDKAQSQQILNAVIQLSDINQEILNSLNRIGVSYDYEQQLRIAEKKYLQIKNNPESSMTQRLNAQNEVNLIKGREAKSPLDKNELNALLTRYEKATEKLGGVLWPIAT